MPNIIVEVSDKPISLTEATKHVKSDDCGAISSFIGTTRDNFKGRKVLYLEYEAYVGMAVKVIHKIVNEITSSIDVRAIYIAHRLGLLLTSSINTAMLVLTVFKFCMIMLS